MTFQDFVNHISELKKQGAFSEILVFFKTNKHLFEIQNIKNHNHLISCIISSLRKTNNQNSVFKFIEKYNIEIGNNTHEMILNAYGWVIYDKIKHNIANNQFNKYEALTLIKSIVTPLLNKKSEYSYSVIENILRVVYKIEKDKANQDQKFINDFCDLFNPNYLSKRIGTIEINGKIKELASDEENWYMYKSKALFELNRFKECYDISSQAILNLDNYHYNNDLWFARRIALSKKALGNLKDAVNELEIIFKKKNEWFIKKELAELYFEMNDIDKAFEYSIEAINMNRFGKLEMKIGIIALLSDILMIKNEYELAFKHLIFVKQIKEKNGWKVTENEYFKLNELQKSLSLLEINNNLINELKNYWLIFNKSKDMNPKIEETFDGIIKKIMNDNERGKDGWISHNKKDYYFNIPKHIQFINDLKIGTNVLFKIIENNNGKIMAKITKIKTHKNI